jgi:hypothetical protein
MRWCRQLGPVGQPRSCLRPRQPHRLQVGPLRQLNLLPTDSVQQGDRRVHAASAVNVADAIDRAKG